MKRQAIPSTVAEVLAERVGALRAQDIPAAVRAVCQDLLIDIAGLCIAARNNDYVLSLKKSLDSGGPCTALGHTESYSPEDAALLNGTAAHGEDFDDSFEGGPVHSGAVVVPAVLAACERFGRDGKAALAVPAMRERLAAEAIEPMPMTPEQFGRYIQADIARWSALARERKISLD